MPVDEHRRALLKDPTGDPTCSGKHDSLKEDLRSGFFCGAVLRPGKAQVHSKEQNGEAAQCRGLARDRKDRNSTNHDKLQLRPHARNRHRPGSGANLRLHACPNIKELRWQRMSTQLLLPLGLLGKLRDKHAGPEGAVARLSQKFSAKWPKTGSMGRFATGISRNFRPGNPNISII